MPSASLEAQDSSESDNDFSTVIRKRRRTRPDVVRQNSGSRNAASNVSPDKPLTRSSETPFTKGTDQTTNTWSSFIVPNFLQEARKDDAPEISTASSQEGHASHFSNIRRGDGPARGHVQVSTTTESRQKRSMVGEGNTGARNGHHDHISPVGESRNKKRKLDRQTDRTMGTTQHRSRSDRQPPFVVPEISGTKELRHHVSSRSDLQPGLGGRNYTGERGSTETPSETVSREIFKAVKHTPITAEAKARQRLMDIKQGRAPVKTDEELFSFFEAKQPTKQRNQIVEGLLGPEKQREAVDNSFSYPPTSGPRNWTRSPNVFHPGGGGIQKQPAPQSRLNVPKKQNIVLPKPKTQTQVSNRNSNIQNPKASQPGPSKGAKAQARTQAQQPINAPAPITAPSVSPEPTDASPPPAPPIQTISAEDFLGGPERLVSQWVVYRTQRFPPLKTLASGQVITVDKQKRKIRCTIHVSKRAANEAAAARLERVHKDIVRKSWSLAGFGKGLFEGVLEYDAGDGAGGGQGDVMHFWVEEEIVDLAKVMERFDSDGKRLLLDVQKAGVYARKRYDVWSIVAYPAPGSTERSQRQNLMVDCGGTGDKDEEMEGDGQDENDDGDEEGESESSEGGTNVGNEKELEQVSDQSPGSSTGSSETLTAGDIGKDAGIRGFGRDADDQQSTAKGANTDISFSSTATLIGEEAVVGTGTGVTIDTTDDSFNLQTHSDDVSTDVSTGSCQAIIVKTDTSTKKGTDIDVNIDTSTHAKVDDSQENKQQQTPEAEATTGHSPSPSPPPTPYPPPSHPKIHPPIDPFTIILPPKPTLHGSYTTPQAANVAALQAFLDLTKPKNARIEDHHFYKHFLAPQMQEQFWEEHKADPDTPVKLQWDATDALEEGCKWEFLHIEVQVTETELEGVVDLGGMVVDESPSVDVKGKGKGKEKEKEVERDLPPVMEEEEEDESEISEAE